MRGSPAPAPPTDWAALDRCKIIQLETRSPEPYSINIWAAGLGEQLYLASGGGSTSRWVRNVEADPMVRVQACGLIYSMRATHTTDAAEIERFLAAVKRKYDWKREQALEYRLSDHASRGGHMLALSSILPVPEMQGAASAIR